MLENAPEHFEERRSFSLGKYYLFARLGTGGMADVYLAVARGAMNVTKLAVVKRLRDAQASDPEAREMFINEARLAARLNHPNVIQTFEAGSEGGCYFIAMEYVDGQPLSRIMARLRRVKRGIDPTIIARICSNALEGLHHAHELTDFDGTPLQLIHRDVSPQNIMVTYDGRVKVVDFGIAKAVGTSQTAHGVFKGKVAFMAPEQLMCDKIDRRADLFSMGICLWEAVTGERLMAEDTPAKTLLNLMNKKIPLASEVNPAVPDELAQVIAKALERDPADRYPTAYAMHTALENFVRGVRVVTEYDVRDVACELFGDTREKLQAQIKAHVAKLSLQGDSEQDFGDEQVRNLGSDGLIDLSDVVEHDGSRTNRAVLRMNTTSSGAKLALVSSAPHIAPELATRRKRITVKRWIAIAIAAMVGSGVAFALLLLSGIALVRSQHMTPRAAIRMGAKPASTATTMEFPADEPAPVPASVNSSISVTASPSPKPAEPASAAPIAAPASASAKAPIARPPVRPPPGPRTTAPPTASGESTQDGASVPAQTASPASAQPATPAEPSGRVFRREL